MTDTNKALTWVAFLNTEDNNQVDFDERYAATVKSDMKQAIGAKAYLLGKEESAYDVYRSTGIFYEDNNQAIAALESAQASLTEAAASMFIDDLPEANMVKKFLADL
jgi:hypothetical protein